MGKHPVVHQQSFGLKRSVDAEGRAESGEQVPLREFSDGCALLFRRSSGFRDHWASSMSTVYQIPAVQGETALQKAISIMLRRYMQTHAATMAPDPAIAPGVVALRFAWWLFDHAEELEAIAVGMEEGQKQK
jgi:hypothetical protein